MALFNKVVDLFKQSVIAVSTFHLSSSRDVLPIKNSVSNK
jgi:hypothetical protein